MPVKSDDRAHDATEHPRRVVELEERSWLPRHCRGDAAAFPALVAAYRRPVYSYLVRSGVAESERDDIFQGIILKIHLAAASYQPARPLRPWLFTIAANTVRNHFRDTRTPELVSVDGETNALVDPQPGPERTLEARDTVVWLEGAMTDLPPSQRQVLVLVTIVGLPQQEVAEALDLPINTVKTHLRRARLGLARALIERDMPPNRTGEGDEHLR